MSYLKRIFQRQKPNTTLAVTSSSTAADVDANTIVQAPTSPNPHTGSTDSKLAVTASLSNSNVYDRLAATETVIADLWQFVRRTTYGSAGYQGSSFEYHEAEYIAQELTNYNDQIRLQYMAEEPNDKAAQCDQNAWNELMAAVSSAEEKLLTLLAVSSQPEKRTAALLQKEALDFCIDAKSVIQAERQAENLFHIFRDSKLRRQKENAKVKAAKLQNDSIRADIAATVLGAIARSVNATVATAAQVVPGNS